MEDLSSLQTGGKKNFYMIGALVVIGLLLFVGLPQVIPASPPTDILASYSGKLTPGGNTTLTIELKNSKSMAVHVAKVVLVVYANDMLFISPEEVSVGTVGPGEYRRLTFEVNASSQALPGKYLIEVKRDFVSETKTDTLELFVES